MVLCQHDSREIHSQKHKYLSFKAISFQNKSLSAIKKNTYVQTYAQVLSLDNFHMKWCICIMFNNRLSSVTITELWWDISQMFFFSVPLTYSPDANFAKIFCKHSSWRFLTAMQSLQQATYTEIKKNSCLIYTQMHFSHNYAPANNNTSTEKFHITCWT